MSVLVSDMFNSTCLLLAAMLVPQTNVEVVPNSQCLASFGRLGCETLPHIHVYIRHTFDSGNN